MKTQILDEAEVLTLLRHHSVPTHTWNGKTTKTLAELMHSISSGEAYLATESDSLILHFHVAVGAVKHEINGVWHEIYEDRQILADGSIKRRNFPPGIAEKIRTRHETPIKAVRRGLKEELGFHPKSGYVLSLDGRYTLHNSGSDWFPGLSDLYHRHVYNCFIPQELYRAEYVERFLTRTIHFLWKPITDPVVLARLP